MKENPTVVFFAVNGIAAGVLYPAFGLLLSPVFAGAAMALLGLRGHQRVAS